MIPTFFFLPLFSAGWEKLQLYISSELLKEVSRKLRELKASEDAIEKAHRVLMKGRMVSPKVIIETNRDPNDNFLLELAETSKADYLITRDKDLLDLKSWKQTKILKPEDFLPLLRKKHIL